MSPLKCMVAFTFGVLLLVTASASNTSAQDATFSVSIQDFAFKAASITITAGTTVVWTNNDSVTHTVTSRDGAFDSGNLAPGQSYEHAFISGGTIEYFCKIHPAMQGKVVVKPQAPIALEAALDVNHNRHLDDAEILTAVDHWIKGVPVPGTDLAINDAQILRLIHLWITGESIL